VKARQKAQVSSRGTRSRRIAHEGTPACRGQANGGLRAPTSQESSTTERLRREDALGAIVTACRARATKDALTTDMGYESRTTRGDRTCRRDRWECTDRVVRPSAAFLQEASATTRSLSLDHCGNRAADRAAGAQPRAEDYAAAPGSWTHAHSLKSSQRSGPNARCSFA